MLVLPLQVGPTQDERYGLPCRQVAEVVPVVPLRRVPHAPAYLAGLFVYRGAVVPVIDVAVLLGGEATRHRLSTRIIIANTSSGHHVGLLAEGVTEPIELGDDGTRLDLRTARYLGAVALAGSSMIQLLRVDDLVNAELEAMLFAAGDT